MLRLFTFYILITIVCSQQYQPMNVGCGFTCTKKAQFITFMDGTLTSASCTTSLADPRYRCLGCCQSRALIAGLAAADATGFPSNNGVDCICCFYNKCR
ncbi:unnamed protein product [Cylicocyclus nassatus]|uniref:Uncharacterized protein n=1 Tax=Cylicocyclus nassatus TaxID=53992 RepID=A0AA36H3E6_CYLNA|nr:unnamed protein product [Cylicocyclus nassatus]